MSTQSATINYNDRKTVANNQQKFKCNKTWVKLQKSLLD